MSAERLWMPSIEAAYIQKFDAKITSIFSDQVTLDRTHFYPLGGGQEWDLGTLESESGSLVQVSEVRGRDEIFHTVGEGHGLELGESVVCEIDWKRRYSHMRMHTAQHLISAVVGECTNGARTVGNQIHAERSRIDFQPVQFSSEVLEEIKFSANSLIDDDLPVYVEQMTRSELNQLMPVERTNLDLIPNHINNLRVIRIGDNFDLCPCAGTHVKSLGEIGHMEWISPPRSKGKQTQRLTYTLA